MPVSAAIVLAGGTGSRLGLDGGKQLAKVCGIPVLAWTLLALDRVEDVRHIVLVCPADRLDEYRLAAVEPFGLRTPVSFAPSGNTRQSSAASGLSSLPPGFELVAIHDGARPLIDSNTVARALAVLAATPTADGIVVGHPAIDTLKLVEDGSVVSTPDRSHYWLAQTPQIFRFEVFSAAMRSAELSGFVGTDDSAVVEHIGGRVLMFEGPRDNIKVTVSEDLAFAEATLRQRSGDM